MRIDKLTTKFQEALSEAQSLALAKDNQYIEPAHLLLAMLRDSDGGAKSLLTTTQFFILSYGQLIILKS